jgi:hypothetical protein
MTEANPLALVVDDERQNPLLLCAALESRGPAQSLSCC